MGETLGQRIKRERKFKGLTQEQLAIRAGISFMSVRRYESGERTPTIKTLNKIADALGLSMAVFTAPDVTWRDSDGAYQFVEPMEDVPSWLLELESKLKPINAQIGNDAASKEWYILYDGERIDLSENDLIALNDSINSFSRFRIEELRGRGSRT